MRHVMTRVLLAAFLLGSAGAAMQRSAYAAGYDGSWSVLIVTEQGTCDRGYRYNVNVSNGQVRYEGDAGPVNLTGTVTPAGLVKVSIKVGDQGADGTGHLSASSGAGTWRGAGASGASCAGHWEAERR
jgi:hypothetical protein